MTKLSPLERDPKRLEWALEDIEETGATVQEGSYLAWGNSKLKNAVRFLVAAIRAGELVLAAPLQRQLDQEREISARLSGQLDQVIASLRQERAASDEAATASTARIEELEKENKTIAEAHAVLQEKTEQARDLLKDVTIYEVQNDDPILQASSLLESGLHDSQAILSGE